MAVGVLALQGDFEAHAAALERSADTRRTYEATAAKSEQQT